MQTLLGKRIRKTDLTFYKNGRIDISAHVANILSIHKGDVIDVLIDNPDYGMEIYLYVRMRAPTVGKYEATCFQTHKRSRNFRTYSKCLSSKLLSLCKTDSDKLKLAVGSPTVLSEYGTVLPIIYKNVLS